LRPRQCLAACQGQRQRRFRGGPEAAHVASGGQRRGRRCPNPMPRKIAFCRSPASVRFIFFAISLSVFQLSNTP
jgi:hypothetical protein